MRLRLAVLVSGRGSNMESILRESLAGRLDAEVVLVLSNRADAPALATAAAAGIRTACVPSQGRPREEHEREVAAAVDAASPDLVVLAGYMRILSPWFIQRFAGRLVNIHPSLLPSFPGMDAQAQAHAAGVRVAGCTVHFVSEVVDGGPILAQAAVAIPPGATPEEVRARILRAEHRLYPHAIQLLAAGRARLEGGRVAWKDAGAADDAIVLSPGAP